VKLNRALLFSLIALALVLSCSASGARESSAAAPAGDAIQVKTQFRDGLAGVDFTGLDPAAKERALDIMNAQGCDCGCGMTIAQCRVQDQKCGRSPVLAKMVIDAVKAGKSNSEVVAALNGARGGGGVAPAASKTASISVEGAPFTGDENAKATLVEFADYQCPYCSRAQAVVKELKQKYGDDLKFVFKQLPLRSIHRFAEPAARASVAAARQGKFWEMHDVLFQNSRALDDASLKKYASDLGLDMEQFARDLADPAVAQAVQNDVTEAMGLGVNGTPTFFINNVRVPMWDAGTMGRMIDEAMAGGDPAKIADEINRQVQEQRMAAQRARQAQEAAMATKVFDINIEGAPVLGAPDAPVTIVEFGDFQCPYCAGAQPLVKQVLDAFPGKIKLVFKHMPLTSIHPNAQAAAVAAEAAREQGKFWEMKENLYKNYNKLGGDNLTRIAGEAGLDVAKFQESIKKESHLEAINKSVADARSAMVNSTPTFFVNGKKVMRRDFDTFKSMVEKALAGDPQASK